MKNFMNCLKNLKLNIYNFHNEFLLGKSLVIFCPKLDSDIDRYIEKLSIIIFDNNIKSITAVRMQVPCCGGTP
jgi:hypothetical protein